MRIFFLCVRQIITFLTRFLINFYHHLTEVQKKTFFCHGYGPNPLLTLLKTDLDQDMKRVFAFEICHSNLNGIYRCLLFFSFWLLYQCSQNKYLNGNLSLIMYVNDWAQMKSSKICLRFDINLFF